MSAPFQKLDHIAIIVRDTDEALKFYRDRLGLPFLFSQVMSDAPIRLTHLDAGGGVHLQLVQPLKEDHPLKAWLATHGVGLHHFCFAVDDRGQARAGLAAHALAPGEPACHQGTLGKQALFLDRAGTDNVQVELTGA